MAFKFALARFCTSHSVICCVKNGKYLSMMKWNLRTVYDIMQFWKIYEIGGFSWFQSTVFWLWHKQRSSLLDLLFDHKDGGSTLLRIVYQITWRHIPKHSTLHDHRRENLWSHECWSTIMTERACGLFSWSRSQPNFKIFLLASSWKGDSYSTSLDGPQVSHYDSVGF
jgi:hypothetical protein